MAVRLPRYMRSKKLAGGQRGWFWELPHWARPTVDKKTGEVIPVVRHGIACPLTSEALGIDVATAWARADILNGILDDWRKGVARKEMAKGSVEWLFAWYREQDRFKSNKHKTRKDYRAMMDLVCAISTNKGQSTLGKRMASKIDASVADSIYAKLKVGGERQATYAMQVCRLVWRWAVRHSKATGVRENPFSGMGLKSVAKAGNRATSREEYNLYRETARAMGLQSMATAAALAFEGCQRVWDVFGFDDPDGREHRGIPWAGYRPGEEIVLVQGKTGNDVALPLFIEIRGPDGKERVALYPELEEELARARAVVPADFDFIVMEERTGKKYLKGWASKQHRRICNKAGLPTEMKFTGFRHGGITELGDAGATDTRAVSGHKTLAMTTIYNKANREKARQIAAARREHIARLGGGDEGDA